MADIRTQIGDIAYNPATQRFEALVVFHTGLGRFSIAATHDAPLTAGFDEISDVLLRDALAGLTQAGRLRARLVPAQPVAEAAPQLPFAA